MQLVPLMHRWILLYTLLLFSTNLIVGQNLITNPGFETYSICPNGYNVTSDKELVPGWLIPSPGTSDYFNRCDKTGRSSVPKNAMGYMEAKEGNAYAGIILSDFALYEKGERNYREYLQNRLIEPMVKGTVYCVKFYYCVATNSRYSVNRLGVNLSTTRLKSENNLIDLKPAIEINPNTIIDKKDAWLEFCGTYLAEGGERYFTLGNFYTDSATLAYDFKEGKGMGTSSTPSKIENFAYYFVDMVSVVPLDESCCFANIKRHDFPGPTPVETGKTYVLKNIYFGFDSFELSENSIETLNKLFLLIAKNPNWRIEISGHTDIIGPYAYNHTLSLKRAGAVANYLKIKGIAENRIHFSGYGFQVPVYSNATSFGRSKNRRVEFKMYNINPVN